MSNRRNFLRQSATALTFALIPIPAMRESVVSTPKAVVPHHTIDAARDAIAQHMAATLEAIRRKHNEHLLCLLEENTKP